MADRFEESCPTGMGRLRKSGPAVTPGGRRTSGFGQKRAFRGLAADDRFWSQNGLELSLEAHFEVKYLDA